MYIKQKIVRYCPISIIFATVLCLSVFIDSSGAAKDPVCQNQTTVNAIGQYPLSSPGEMVMRPDGKFLFVLDSYVVSVVDTDTNAVVAQMPAGQLNRGIIISPDGSTLFICGYYEGQILQYSTSGDEPKAFYQKGVLFNMPKIQGIKGQPSAIAISSDGSTLYIADRTSGQVVAVSTATGSESLRIVNPNSVRHPSRLLIGGDMLYVLFSTSRNIGAYNLTEQRWINTVITGGSPSDMELGPEIVIAGNSDVSTPESTSKPRKLYVSRSGGIDIFDSQTLESLDKIENTELFQEPKNMKLVKDVLLAADQGKGSIVMFNTKSQTFALKYASCSAGREPKWLAMFKDENSKSDMVAVYAANADESIVNFSFSLIDLAIDPVNYNSTARLMPQVIASGLSPSKLDIGGTEFDILALVRPGRTPIDNVAFNSSGGVTKFLFEMNRAGILENGDEVYKAAIPFPRVGSPLPTITTAWGSGEGQFNIVAKDIAGQISKQFPDLIFGNYPAMGDNAAQEPEPLTYISTRRRDPQIVMAGFSPCLIDVGDTKFDLIAIVREGVSKIDRVKLTCNTPGWKDIEMNGAGTLDNEDKVYKTTFTFPRGSLDAMNGVDFNDLWGPGDGQFQIQAIDVLEGKSHDFPNIEIGNFPEYKP